MKKFQKKSDNTPPPKDEQPPTTLADVATVNEFAEIARKLYKTIVARWRDDFDEEKAKLLSLAQEAEDVHKALAGARGKVDRLEKVIEKQAAVLGRMVTMLENDLAFEREQVHARLSAEERENERKRISA